MCPTCGSEFERCLFELQVKNSDGNIRNIIAQYPSPHAMEEWTQKIEFPLKSITNETEIFVKNGDGLFVKI
jgi:hypothetical protein